MLAPWTLLSGTQSRANPDVTMIPCIQPEETNFLHTTVCCHGHSMNCGHYTASTNYFGKHFMSTKLELHNPKSIIPMTHLQHIYYCITWSVFDKTAEGGNWSPPMAPAHLSVHWIHVEELASKSMGWTICSLLMMPCLIQTLTRKKWLYMIYTEMSNSGGL